MAGKVVVDGVVVTKPGTLIKASAQIFLRGTPLRFASRGGYKLEHALERFSISVAGRVCLDAGAAAGGFTDCMLQCSARLIYPVDAGYGQLRTYAALPRRQERQRLPPGTAALLSRRTEPL
jgi:23S rRNA (cytidine1920-2'-O)/16S rRNA (cytidine1409-2'-O)-methyltransferase